MFKTKMYRLLTGGRSLILAYDQGLEHGPTDFNLKNIDPNYILDIAEKGGYNALVFQRGLAEKYYQNYRDKVRLILKLNGKTSIAKVEPYSAQTCSVSRAIKLGAEAVGYTVYVGSPREAQIFEEFSKIAEEAHDHGIPVVAWMYPRGPFVPNDSTTEIIAYSARVGLELGADIVKIKYNNDFEGFKWVVKAAGKCKVVVAGGHKEAENELLQQAKEIVDAGATGMAIGRNVWQHPEPLKISQALKKIIIENKSVKEALKSLKK
ncbi:fructose-bisphosphate aldolase [Candidatus Woesearchaeota archaeon]|nr:fructose-bisphosphate aldolase [Candidatus Woesearchaeota archaeon]